MTTKMEYTGKDVTEAIKTACTQLGVSQDQLTIEIKAMGSAGVFGLCRRDARIVVSLKADTEGRLEPAIAEGGAAPERRAPAPEPARQLTELIEAVKNDLSRLLDLMGFPSKVDATQEDQKVLVQIEGPHLEEIIGPDGQTLDNLQYLLRKMISKKFAEKVTISLDAGNYRENRSKELKELALKLAREVKETGKTSSIPALNPAERRIVHMALQGDGAIRSRSVGEGLFKKILIYLPGKNKKRPARTTRGSKSSS